MQTINIKELSDFCEKILDYKFKDENLLKQALTHSSYANEKRGRSKSNERLEFLGDSVLSIIISKHLYINSPKEDEGVMSKNRAYIVCEKSLAKAAREINLGKYLYLGNGEDRTGGRDRDSILSDAFEALIAALYLDAGMEKTEQWVLRRMKDIIAETDKGKTMRDYKTMLQEKYPANGEARIEYRLISEEGPDHNRCFTIQVLINGKAAGTGRGRNKKAAEQAAAEEALQK